jgi:hypothetical protein
MNTHIQSLEERLKSLFQRKAAEFSRYADEDPSTAIVTSQLAGLYQDLAEAITH